MTEQFAKMRSKRFGNLEPAGRIPSQSTNNLLSQKQPRKGENTVRLPSVAGLSQEFGSSNALICKNSACRAFLSLDDAFCKRCSCCICRLFDDNKDPSLWLVCTSKCDNQDSCGLSCHIECALQWQKVGVSNLGQIMQLDGSYCCTYCGKVSSILECWKKQLIMAKDARRIDVLCYRISLSCRLLNGTSKFKELHQIVIDAKAKLETEVGPVIGDSAKMARGIVSRLSVAADVQNLCSLAIERADAWLRSISNVHLNRREDPLPADCAFVFEEVTSSSLVIVLKELGSPSKPVKGYMLWHCKSTDQSSLKEPISFYPRTQKRILISNLQPCTEYLFQLISYTDHGDLCHYEANCFTKSIEILHQSSDSDIVVDPKSHNSQNEASPSSAKKKPKSKTTICSSNFEVQDSRKVLYPTLAEEQGSIDGFCSADADEFSDSQRSNSHELNLNVSSVPDLNAELTPPLESSSRDKDNELELVVEAEHDAVSTGMEKTELCTPSPKSGGNECISSLITRSPFQLSGGLGELDRRYEYCVMIIRWLEREGHIKQEFRMKFLTWFSLRSTEQEQKVVNTFIQNLLDEPGSLAGQLVDSFSDIINSKRPRNDLFSRLWH